VNDIENNQLFCWQQIERSDPLYRVTHSFADRAIADRLLALHAFLAATGDICAMVSDEAVAARKLAWWHDEMHGGAGSGRPHPITSELRRTGGSVLLDSASLGHHFEQASKRFDPDPMRTLEDLLERCRRIGRPMLEMEFSVCEAQVPEGPWFDSMARRRGLVQLVREDLARRDAWWLPLDLLARHGLGRKDIREAGKARSVQGLIKEISRQKELWISSDISDISQLKQSVKHVVFRDHLIKRKLKNRNLNSPDRWPEWLSKASLLDLFMGWQAARRVSPWK
jgi:phytoene synthase